MTDKHPRLDLDTYRSIGELQEQVLLLESQVSLLMAFVCALLEILGAKRDELESRWARHLGPMLTQLGHLDEEHKKLSVEALGALLAEMPAGRQAIANPGRWTMEKSLSEIKRQLQDLLNAKQEMESTNMSSSPQSIELFAALSLEVTKGGGAEALLRLVQQAIDDE